MKSNSDARMTSARYITRVMTPRGIVFLAALIVVGCTGREAASTRDSSATAESADAAGASGRGHLHLTGDATVDTDFTVEQCAIGPAGEGLLNGYHMNAKSGHGALEMLAVVVKDYERDGTFSPVTDSGKAARVGKHGLSAPLTMMVNRANSTVPLAVIPKPESKLSITIADSGASGTAEFTDMTSPLAMEDIDIKSRGRTKGKTFAGSLSWRCPSVQHVDAKTSDAAKGMMKGLTPIH
jgi:hypothetical protein